jgi:dynein heavy chain
VEAYGLRKELNKAFDLVKQFHDREQLFGLPETPYPDLEEIDKSFKPFFELITMSFDVKQGLTDWTTDRLMGQDPNKIQSEVQRWNQMCFQLYKKLNEDYPETAEVCTELRHQIEAFSKNLPLIKCLTSEAINLDEDWKDIIEVIGAKPEDFPREEIKVSQFETFELYKYIEEIEEITMKAEKKFSLGQKLKQMRDEMRGFELV